MTIPYRGQTGNSTYFVSANTWERKRLLQSDRSARLFLEVLYHYRAEKKYLLHEFVVMPDHFHVLLTPTGVTLERCLQLIKGGYSFRAHREFDWRQEIWQSSFHDRRVRDAAEYQNLRE